MLTKMYVVIWSHLGTMGLNHWAQSKAVDMILDQYSASHAHSRAWNGNAHCRANVVHHGPIFWKTGFIKLFLDYTKWFNVTTLACIQILKSVIGQKGDQQTFVSQIHDVKCRSVPDINNYLVVSEHRCVYLHCRAVWLLGCVKGPMCIYPWLVNSEG